MKRMNAKYLALFCAVCAAFSSSAVTTWKVTGWSGNRVPKASRFTEALNSTSDDEIIIELQNNMIVNADAELKLGKRQTSKKVIVTSSGSNRFTIQNQGDAFGFKIAAGTTLVLSNVTYDCAGYSQIEDVFYLAPQSGSGSSRKVARMILENGATICNAEMATYYNYENAVIHVKRGAVFTMRPGSAILNCKNESSPGKGGAICCDYGTVIMTGGTIAGCTAKGAGGAIHTDGTRVDSTDGYDVNERGDIYISGGYITNNACGAGLFGGGIYLGNSGPVLHITGTAVISNNFSGALGSGVADDVSTYNLDDRWANRLKLVDYHESHPEGFTYAGQLFTGWVGVRYPRADQESNPENKHFGAVWEYFNGSQEEARNFFWNGNNAYRGKMDANSLVWSSHVVHELPKDGLKVSQLIASGESPIYMELSEDYRMSAPAVITKDMNNLELVLDLKGFNLTCDFHVSNETSRVTIFDSSTNKSGTVTGHRDSDFANAFCLEGGSYATLPRPEWVASNRVVVGNYCTEHPYMVAIKVWDMSEKCEMTDLTKVSPEDPVPEIREVTLDDNGVPDIGEITFSSGDWKFKQYTNMNYRVQVLAAPCVQDRDGSIRESGPRIVLHDSHEQADIAPHNQIEAESNGSASEGYGREDSFIWDAAESHGLVKLIHVTMRQSGELYETNATDEAYFRFPEALFEVTQRKTGGPLPITVIDSLLTALNYNRASGFYENHVNATLDGYDANGLRRWENIVTGTDENQLLLSTAAESEGGLALNIALTETGKRGRTDTGYHVRYSLSKYDDGGWRSVGEIKTAPEFSIPLLDGENKSAGATGFYRVTTLIIPDNELSVTNEIPSTNIVGVLEVASTLTNTLAAVPWTALAENPAAASANPVTVSNYVHTPHLDNDDSVQVFENGLYRKWNWNKTGGVWTGEITVTGTEVVDASEASERQLSRNSSVWVTRRNPAAKPFFLIGQYSSAPVTLHIAGDSSDAPEAVCTLVPNPSLEAVKVNDFKWNGRPSTNDIIRIPNEKKAPHVLRWENGEWGRLAGGEWKNDTKVPAGTGFWYMRCGEPFEIELPSTRPDPKQN